MRSLSTPYGQAPMPDILETRRLLLEPWHERHIEEFIRLTADGRVMRHIGRGVPWSRAEAAQRFRGMMHHWEEHDFGWRSAIEKATSAWVGVIALNYLGRGVQGVDEGEIEIGWWLHASAWHRGLGTEGGQAACDEAFGQLGAPRIIARCRPENTPSLRIMQKLGMAPWMRVTGRYGEMLSVHVIDRATWLPPPPPSPREGSGR
jgi:RimJ/RimL family protein N-acetyltransferase